jgi:hypothetical protein
MWPRLKSLWSSRLRRSKASGVLLLVYLASCAQASPKITLSRDKVDDRGAITLTGSGFPAKAIVYSHLKRPDGTDFPPLRFLTDDKGEFTHKIETFTLLAGTHEVWVVDGAGHSSNVLRFEVAEKSVR